MTVCSVGESCLNCSSSNRRAPQNRGLQIAEMPTALGQDDRISDSEQLFCLHNVPRSGVITYYLPEHYGTFSAFALFFRAMMGTFR